MFAVACLPGQCTTALFGSPRLQSHVPLVVRASTPFASADDDDGPAEFDIELSKPLGIEFEDSADGMVVKRVLSKGAAAESTFVWPGDVLCAIGSQKLMGKTFDESMEALVQAPETVELTFLRPLKVTCLEFPNGKRAFGRRGEPLAPLALRVGYNVQYDCGTGSCGTCELVLRNSGSESCKSVRMCRAKMPAADLCPFELLTPDSEEAQEFYEVLAAKAEGRA